MRLRHEREYQQIMGLYAQLVDTLANWVPDDERLLDTAGLVVKLFYHAASAYALARGTNLEPLFGTRRTIFAHPSVAVLARASLETYLAFHYVFVDCESEDQFSFRHSAWSLSGFTSREAFPVLLPEHRAQQVREKQLNDQLRERINKTMEFSRLSPDDQERVLNGKKWRFDGWVAIAERAGIGKGYSKYMYALLSSHVHSDSLSAWQTEQANPQDSLELAESHLLFTMCIVSKMILAWTDRFPETRQVLGLSPEATALVHVNAEALARLHIGERT